MILSFFRIFAEVFEYQMVDSYIESWQPSSLFFFLSSTGKLIVVSGTGRYKDINVYRGI